MEELMNKIETKENSSDLHTKFHTEAKKLLGEKYDEQKVNGCMALQASGELEKAVDELKRDLENAEREEEKNTIREAWLEKYDAMVGITH